MGRYTAEMLEGSYSDRQALANERGAVCFVAQHFNSALTPEARYTLCNVASNAGKKSKAWAAYYARRVGETFGVPLWGTDGVCIGGMGGRGDGQIKHVACPAILCEPLFCSNPEHAAILRSDHGRQTLAEVLVDSIQAFFPKGGLVALSVGHLGKPGGVDRGALVYAAPGEPELWEGDVAIDVLQRATALLESI